MTAHQATQDGRFKAEIHPLDCVDHDLLLRPDTSLEKLAKLKPVFDRSAAGTITAGNSSPLTDGAAPLVLMSERRAIEEGHEPLAQADRSSRRRRVSRTLPTPDSAPEAEDLPRWGFAKRHVTFAGILPLKEQVLDTYEFRRPQSIER